MARRLRGFEALRILIRFKVVGYVAFVLDRLFGLYTQEMLLMPVFDDEQVIILCWPCGINRLSDCLRIAILSTNHSGGPILIEYIYLATYS